MENTPHSAPRLKKKPRIIAPLTKAEVQKANADLGGRWTVLREAGRRYRTTGQLRKQWRVQCTCGVECELYETDLITKSGNGRARSTGCRSRKCAYRWDVSRGVVEALSERLVADMPRYLQGIANDCMRSARAKEVASEMEGEE